MTLKKYKDIIAIQTTTGEYVALHTLNLEVAAIDQATWNAINSPSENQTSEPLKELDLWNYEKNANTKSGKLTFGVRHLTINVTQLCNLACKYCAAGGDGTFGDPIRRIEIEKTLPQIKYFLEQTPEGKSFSIHFLGGEPLLYPEAIRAIADYANQLASKRNIQVRYIITTNGTLITPQIVDLFEQLKCKIQISLDGPAEINDLQRVNKAGQGSTSQTLKGLGLLIENKSRLGRIGISAVFNRQNLDVCGAYKYFSSFNVDWYEFTFSLTEQDTSASDQFINEMQKVAEIAWEKGGETELRKIEAFNHYFSALDNLQRVENHCGAGKTALMINARNELFTCPWVVGNKQEVIGKDTQLEMNKLDPYQSPLIEANNCANCWARYLCGGGCMYVHQNRTGSKHQVNPDFCKRTRSLIAGAIMYYELSRRSYDSH